MRFTLHSDFDIFVDVIWAAVPISSSLAAIAAALGAADV